MPSYPITGHLRGGLVGVLVGVLAVAAHGVAGGGFPGSSELTRVLLIATAVGSAAGAIPSGRRPTVLVGLLGAGQLVSHGALAGLLGHQHAETTGVARLSTDIAPPTGWMLVAHTVATLGCAALIVLTERLYAAASGALHAISVPVRRARGVTAARWSCPGLPPYRCPANGAIGPRAPPVSI
ncbi:hypothetical protein AB0B25_00615 [Nocardia sp. NPDC049190]|uniref:hypothetical protein n=1 Tax=Nocardia sp. NPDC049190 TaxID=3155650 RepID=UPI0033EE4DD5